MTKEIITYQAKDGKISFDVNVFEETVWLSQKQMAELYDVRIPTINEHLKNIFNSHELNANSVIRDFLITASDGKKYNTKIYNLDVIISLGYRVNSRKATQFRQWATRILKQYMMNGYAVNETRIRKIESSLDELVASQKLLKEDVDGIKNLLVRLIERPIVIQNHNRINIGSARLEEKIIKLLDEVAKSLKNKNSAKKQIEELKSDAKKIASDSNARNRLLLFLQELGDDNSKIRKIIKGAGVTKKLVLELLKLSEKIKNLV